MFFLYLVDALCIYIIIIFAETYFKRLSQHEHIYDEYIHIHLYIIMYIEVVCGKLIFSQ